MGAGTNLVHSIGTWLAEYGMSDVELEVRHATASDPGATQPSPHMLSLDNGDAVVLFDPHSGDAAAYLHEIIGGEYKAEAAATSEAKNFPKITETNIRLTKDVYRKVIQFTQYLAQTDGLASNFIEGFLEMNANGFENRVSVASLRKSKKQTAQTKPEGSSEADLDAQAADTTDKIESQKRVFDVCCRMINSGLPDRPRGMDEVFRKFQYNWWVNGMCGILRYPGMSPNITANKSQRYKMPTEIEILDCAKLDLDELKTKGIIAYEWGEAVQKVFRDLKKQGVKLEELPLIQLWPKTVKPADAIRGNWIDQAKAIDLILKNKPTPLPPNRVTLVRRVFDDTQVYPIPYLVRYFQPAMDKHTLREMDRSLMRKIINLILLIQVNNPDRDGKPGKVTPEQLKAATEAVEKRMEDSSERMQVVSTPGTYDLKYVSVPSDVLFNRDNYRVANYEAFCALVGIMANQLLSDSGAIDITMIAKMLYGKNELCIQAFRRMLEEIYYYDIIIPNKMQFEPDSVDIVFKRLSIFETDSFKAMIRDGIRAGYLPARIAVDHINENYEWVREMLIQEAEDRLNNGIFIGIPMYSQTVYKEGAKNPKEAAKQQKEDTTQTPTPGKPGGKDNDKETEPK